MIFINDLRKLKAIALGVSVLCLAGCVDDIDVYYDPSLPKIPPSVGCELEDGSYQALGKLEYETFCVDCHGPNGEMEGARIDPSDGFNFSFGDENYEGLFDVIWYGMPIGIFSPDQCVEDCAAKIWAYIESWDECEVDVESP